jgi:hypothetical protein
MTDERAALAAEAFIYGFPLVFDLQQVGRFARSGIGDVPATPFNRFGHASQLAGPEAGYEASYAMVYQDEDGTQLNGGSRYQLRFGQTPPVSAFWSVTMYDTPNFFLVANPIGRYSVGDRTPGLHFADDGSLTIFMQRDEPQSPEQRANWLPAPAGDFRPILRMYEPGEAVFDGRYELPPITKGP